MLSAVNVGSRLTIPVFLLGLWSELLEMLSVGLVFFVFLLPYG